MEKQDAYDIGKNISGFIDTLRENDFRYNNHTKVISSMRVKGPRLGRLVRDGENYVIINYSEKVGTSTLVEKNRLVRLLEKS